MNTNNGRGRAEESQALRIVQVCECPDLRLKLALLWAAVWSKWPPDGLSTLNYSISLGLTEETNFDQELVGRWKPNRLRRGFYTAAWVGSTMCGWSMYVHLDSDKILIVEHKKKRSSQRQNSGNVTQHENSSPKINFQKERRFQCCLQRNDGVSIL